MLLASHKLHHCTQCLLSINSALTRDLQPFHSFGITCLLAHQQRQLQHHISGMASSKRGHHVAEEGGVWVDAMLLSHQRVQANRPGHSAISSSKSSRNNCGNLSSYASLPAQTEAWHSVPEQKRGVCSKTQDDVMTKKQPQQAQAGVL